MLQVILKTGEFKAPALEAGRPWNNQWPQKPELKWFFYQESYPHLIVKCESRTKLFSGMQGLSHLPWLGPSPNPTKWRHKHRTRKVLKIRDPKHEQDGRQQVGEERQVQHSCASGPGSCQHGAEPGVVLEGWFPGKNWTCRGIWHLTQVENSIELLAEYGESKWEKWVLLMLPKKKKQPKKLQGNKFSIWAGKEQYLYSGIMLSLKVLKA